MWKSEKSPRSSADTPQESGSVYQDTTDLGVFARANNAPANIDELRGQGGFGVIMAASDMQPAMQQPALRPMPSIGSRFTSELESVSRRERQLREMQELATHRVIDLTTDQLRRILDFML